MVEIPRDVYRRILGPTAGDRIRLADTDLLIEVERDLCAGGDDRRRRHGPGHVALAQIADRLRRGLLGGHRPDSSPDGRSRQERVRVGRTPPRPNGVAGAAESWCIQRDSA